MADHSAAFSEIYRRHSADVVRFAFHLCGNQADAEDLTSETFVRAWTTSTPIAAATVRAYLFTIARHLWLRRMRDAGRYVELPDHVADAAPPATAVVESRETLGEVDRRLSAFAEIDRTAFRMRVDGQPYEQIATTLGITEGAARVKIHRVRAALAGIR